MTILVILTLGGEGCRPSKTSQEPIIVQRGYLGSPTQHIENTLVEWPIRLRLENGAVVVLPAKQQSVQVDVPAKDIEEMEKYLIPRIDVLAPDGWKNSVNVLVGKREIAPRRKHQPAKTIKTAEVSFRDQISLYFDNRANAATEVNIGELSFTLPQNGTGVVIFPRLVAGHECSVRLDGRDTGKVSATKDVSYLLDTSGRRVYRYNYVLYQSATNPVGNSGESNIFKGAQLYVVRGSIDYFLDSAPDSVHSAGGYATRTELIDYSPAP